MRYAIFKVINKFQEFLPEQSDFEISHVKVPELERGEFLVQAQYISVDPYMWSFAHSYKVPYEQFGFQVGKIVYSKNPEYPTDMTIVSHSGWREYAILNGDADNMFGMKPYDPQIGELPLSLALGALGMPGITAYLGFLEICKPKKDDVVCVTSAAGAVGSLVCQIAKLKGCTVIGFTGSDEKVEILLKEFEIDHAFNYKTTEDIKTAIQSVVKGIDCFFDTVGGSLSASIVECMNENGRVAVCGSISTYGNPKDSMKPKASGTLKIESFTFTQWGRSVQQAALHQLREWVQKGTIKVKETVANGFEKLPDMFVAMLKGETVGKALVKV